MGTLRLMYRLTGIVVWTTFMFTLRLLVLTVLPVAPIWELRISQWMFHVYSRVVWRVVGLRVHVVGTPPRPPFFMVSNHLSYLDIFVLTGTVGCIFVSRADAAHWPVVGFMIRRMNTIFIDRSQRRDTVRVNDEIRRAMARGYGVHVFAESRVSQDATVHEFKPALLQPAAEMGLPVHYASLSYRTPPGFPGAKELVVWHDGVSMFGNLWEVLKLPWVEAHVVFGDAPIQATDRKSLAVSLWKAVSDGFRPMT